MSDHTCKDCIYWRPNPHCAGEGECQMEGEYYPDADEEACEDRYVGNNEYQIRFDDGWRGFWSGVCTLEHVKKLRRLLLNRSQVQRVMPIYYNGQRIWPRRLP